MGNISDNTQSRWGRRRPWIFTGALLCAILLPLLWVSPFSGKEATIIYFTIISTLYALAYTMFVIPYTALGFELSNDYDERTKVMSWRMYVGLVAGLCLPQPLRLVSARRFRRRHPQRSTLGQLHCSS